MVKIEMVSNQGIRGEKPSILKSFPMIGAKIPQSNAEPPIMTILSGRCIQPISHFTPKPSALERV